MAKIAIIIIICTFIVLVVIFLIGLAANQHEDEAVWLDSFLDQCTPTVKNRALAERELDMLKSKVSSERYSKLCFKFYDKFKTE
jgi:hypothetical protein